jgi:hypothetical protein
VQLSKATNLGATADGSQANADKDEEEEDSSTLPPSPQLLQNSQCNEEAEEACALQKQLQQYKQSAMAARPNKRRHMQHDEEDELSGPE